MTTDPLDPISLERYRSAIERKLTAVASNETISAHDLARTDYATTEELKHEVTAPESQLKRKHLAIVAAMLVLSQQGVLAESSQPLVDSAGVKAMLDSTPRAKRYKRASFGDPPKLVWNETRFRVRQLLENCDE